MNNNLFYTISNLTDNSIKCIELLYKSLVSKIPNANFKIVVDVKDSSTNTPQHLLDKILFVDISKYKYNEVFCLKFVKEIFDQPYDYFCYLDSDILYFLDNYSFSPDYNYFCHEKGTLVSKFFTDYWPEPINIDKTKYKGINSGFFAINKETGLALNNFMTENLYNAHNPMWWIEQNMFNLFVYKQIFLENHKYKWIDYSNKIELFAQRMKSNTKFIDNKLYHFCGKTGNMERKYQKMTNFLTSNNIKL